YHAHIAHIGIGGFGPNDGIVTPMQQPQLAEDIENTVDVAAVEHGVAAGWRHGCGRRIAGAVSRLRYVEAIVGSIPFRCDYVAKPVLAEHKSCKMHVDCDDQLLALCGPPQRI